MKSVTLSSGSRTTTLGFLAAKRGIVLSDDFTINDLLNYEDNVANIESKYVDNIGKPADPDIIEPGTKITYPSDRMSKQMELAKDQSNGAIYSGTDFATFFQYGMDELIRDERYTPIAEDFVHNVGLGQKTGTRLSYTKVKNEYNVLLWSRSFGGEGEEGRIMNITPFISSINCEETDTGGNFSLNLSSPPYVWTEANGFQLDSENIHIINHNGSFSFYSKEAINNPKHSASNAQFPVPLFQLVPSNNDIVFIQFEPLKSEYEKSDNGSTLRRKLDNVNDSKVAAQSLWISPDDMKGATWDMIGLIDQVSGMASPAESSIITNISGRDLTKLIIEDSNYFFAVDTTLGRNGFQGQRNALNGISAMRNVKGEAEFLEAYTDRTIAYTLGFIFNQMTNISVLDGDGPFAAYGTDINERGVFRKTVEEDVSEERLLELIQTYKLTKEEAQNTQLSSSTDTKLAPGIWKAARLVIDPELADRHIIDSSIATAQGSIQSFIGKVCQQPFAQFFGQTWGDKFYFIARKPPTTLSAWYSYRDAGLVVDVDARQVAEYEFGFAESDGTNWYYIEQKHGIMTSGGTNDQIAFMPSGFIERQAKRYGVKVNHVVSNYVGIRFFGEDSTPEELESFRKQAAEDMQYVLESQAGIPYTRKGTFILLANRRIRSGMFIRFNLTGEIGYVTSTSNVANDRNGNTNRATIVNVERMMVEDHIEKYFDIARLKTSSTKTDKGTEYQYTVEQNEDNIAFFEKKLQFVK